MSPGVVRMAGLAAARASFADTSVPLHDLAGVNFDAEQADGSARTREVKLIAISATATHTRDRELSERGPVGQPLRGRRERRDAGHRRRPLAVRPTCRARGASARMDLEHRRRAFPRRRPDTPPTIVPLSSPSHAYWPSSTRLPFSLSEPSGSSYQYIPQFLSPSVQCRFAIYSSN